MSPSRISGGFCVYPGKQLITKRINIGHHVKVSKNIFPFTQERQQQTFKQHYVQRLWKKA